MDDSQYTPEPFIPTITFADGSVINGRGSTTLDQADLWIWPDDLTDMVEAISIFSNNGKTSSIACKIAHDITNVYTGYTFLNSILQQPDGKLSIRMKRPVQA